MGPLPIVLSLQARSEPIAVLEVGLPRRGADREGVPGLVAEDDSLPSTVVASATVSRRFGPHRFSGGPGSGTVGPTGTLGVTVTQMGT